MLEVAMIAGMMILTAVTHILGLWLLENFSRNFEDRPPREREAVVLLGIALALMALHVTEILQYAALYYWIGALPTFETAVYFSGGAYSTIGSSDVSLPQGYRLVGAMEGVNGMVMIGWSTAYLFTAWREIVRPPA